MLKFAIALIKSQKHYQCLTEIQETIYYALKELNYDCLLTDELNLSDRQYIILGANNLLYLDSVELPSNSIIYNFEQIYADSPWLKAGYIDYLLQYPIWDYSLTNIAQLKQWGINNVQYVPVGYVSQIRRIKLVENKDIDVLFYGSINDRRQKIIDTLEREGIKVEVLFGVYGEERDDYIARSKIVLNMHFYEAQVFEIVRISFLLANEVFVISEKGGNAQEEEYFADGLVFSDYDNLVKTCISYLTKGEKRKKIAKKGFDLMRNRLTSEYLKAVIPSIKSVNNKPQTFIKDFYRKRQAKISLDNGRYQEAITLYEQSLQVEPDCLESYWYLGLAFLYNGDDFTAQLTWTTGISKEEEIDANTQSTVENLLSLLQQELNKKIQLNNYELAHKIKVNIDWLIT